MSSKGDQEVIHMDCKDSCLTRESAVIDRKIGNSSLALSFADALSPFRIYVGQILIADHVKRGTYYDPDRIADVFWNIYINKDQKEIVFKEA